MTQSNLKNTNNYGESDIQRQNSGRQLQQDAHPRQMVGNSVWTGKHQAHNKPVMVDYPMREIGKQEKLPRFGLARGGNSSVAC